MTPVNALLALEYLPGGSAYEVAAAVGLDGGDEFGAVGGYLLWVAGEFGFGYDVCGHVVSLIVGVVWVVLGCAMGARMLCLRGWGRPGPVACGGSGRRAAGRWLRQPLPVCASSWSSLGSGPPGVCAMAG